MAAAGAAFLPSSLFDSKHGRAAQRLLGIGYRAAKRFVGIRAEIEGRGKGWKRLKMSEHCDKVDYDAMSRAWHSDLFSTPDNQNKRTVRIDLGLSAAGERMYDVHERRAMMGTARELFTVFLKSPFAEELRRQTATRKRPRGIKIHYDAWCKAKCQVPVHQKTETRVCVAQLAGLVFWSWFIPLPPSSRLDDRLP